MDLLWYVTARLLARARSDTCRRNQDNGGPIDIEIDIDLGAGFSILVQKLVRFFQFQRRNPGAESANQFRRKPIRGSLKSLRN